MAHGAAIWSDDEASDPVSEAAPHTSPSSFAACPSRQTNGPSCTDLQQPEKSLFSWHQRMGFREDLQPSLTDWSPQGAGAVQTNRGGREQDPFP
eukprot:CAMPEP_0175865084 /NCGR_PEP_ID=MMETSP0107_2-20121207/33451_1 /TAXON_ID=195067 ORGANISM="Goniomonas pacifica, Strain CCMP1869" /NCGR_SAMPLE_ID=MMETSP0107_2 /ASSEMBLY_ACC=CAM_ASM_000203 /LENGTH=93 /DNA_ID=CAMNT_0017182449 /DNA_START=77 /DNA_END=359 /DNA_ORIENTATION=-